MVKNAFGTRSTKKHMVYLAKIMIKALSKMDINGNGMANGIEYIHNHKKLTENEKRYIIFSIGLNIGMEQGRIKYESESQNYYR